MTPGEIIVAAGDIILNEGREAITPVSYTHLTLPTKA